eukprot:570314-Prymnesium_polylepis.2
MEERASGGHIQKGPFEWKGKRAPERLKEILLAALDTHHVQEGGKLRCGRTVAQRGWDSWSPKRDGEEWRAGWS